MAGTANANWQQYSRWVWVIARSMRINNPTGADLTLVENFVKAFWDAGTKTGTRPWLATAFDLNANNNESMGDPDIEPTPVDVKNMGVIARDIKKIPLMDSEVGYCDTLFAATDPMRYGDSGNTI